MAKRYMTFRDFLNHHNLYGLGFRSNAPCLFLANDKEYRRSLKDWESFVETLTEKIIEVDDTVPELPIKDVVFRIYRDVRFSKNKTPYKVLLTPPTHGPNFI